MSSPTPGPKSRDEISVSDSTATTPIRVRRRRSVGTKHRRRNIATGLGIAALVIAAFTVWIGYTAFQVKDNIEAARDHAQAAKNALLTGETEEAKRSAADADKYATLARSGTHSLPWNILSPIPFIGSPLETTKQMTDVVHGLTQDVLLPAVDAGTALAPDELIQSGGRIALEPLRDAAPALEQTAKAAKQLAV